ncbi:hypothetical protein OA84_04080 [Kaistella solincola]|uniref:Secreted protein n=1 Tax=Kaistella solincola TaxID=510955 RepID=A0ABR4ZPV2_9FLAO|nr:hypothetical protein OA84_04080 [Kaistella solincola]
MPLKAAFFWSYVTAITLKNSACFLVFSQNGLFGQLHFVKTFSKKHNFLTVISPNFSFFHFCLKFN